MSDSTTTKTESKKPITEEEMFEKIKVHVGPASRFRRFTLLSDNIDRVHYEYAVAMYALEVIKLRSFYDITIDFMYSHGLLDEFNEFTGAKDNV